MTSFWKDPKICELTRKFVGQDLRLRPYVRF